MTFCAGIDKCCPNKKGKAELTEVRKEIMEKCGAHIEMGSQKAFCVWTNRYVSIEKRR